MTRSFHIAPFLFLLPLFLASQTVHAALSDIKLITRGFNNSELGIFTRGYTEPEWDTMLLPVNTCNPPDIIGEKIYNSSRIFEINNTGASRIVLNNVKVVANNTLIFKPTTNLSSETTLEPNESLFFQVDYNCDNDTIMKQDLDGWSYIDISLEADGQPIHFNYLRICTVDNRQDADYSIYIVLIIAVIVVTFATRQKKTLLGDQAEHMDEIKPAHAVFFIVFASISLLTLYFFSQYLKGILSVVFIAYALTGCTIVFTQWTETCVNHSAVWKKHYNVPLVGPTNLHGMACFLVALGIVIAWFITRTWYLNNIIGLSIVCLIFKIVKLPSLKVAYLLLGLAFFYDIFWVFISKPIFGESVMVVAATALDLPIKIEWPYLGSAPIPRCSILGLGDMVLPGFFVTFNYRFGLYKRSGMYYLSSVIAYAFGLALCGGFLIFMRMGQPALLYLVPSLLGAATVVSLKRGEFKEMWEGIPDQEEYKNFDPEKVQLSEIHMN